MTDSLDRLPLRTVEFGLYPTKAQEQQLEAWLELNRRIWNYGIELLQEFAAFTSYNKASKGLVACCPLPWSYCWQKGPDDAWQAIPYSPIRRFRDAPLTCPIPQPWRQPRLDNDSYFSLAKFFAKKNHPNWADLQGCPNNLIRGTLQALAVAWKESRSGKRDAAGRRRKPPRFKGVKFPITTLSDLDSKGSAHVNGDLVQLPKLGEVRIKGNRNGRRFPTGHTVCSYRLQREPSGWFLLLVGEFPHRQVRATTLKVGLDGGVAHTLTTSSGKHIDGPAALTRALRKLERLQQQLARQTKGGANWQKTKAKIARLHEKIRRTRKLFSHKASTYLLRTYSAVVMEDLKLANMVGKPAPKPADDGQSFLPNQAAAKAGLNRAILDAGLGQLRTMIQAKGRDLGRQVLLVNPAHTSQQCPSCGHTSAANRNSQAAFRCEHCGHTCNADHNAAINILRRQFPDEPIPLAPAPLAADAAQLVMLTPSHAPRPQAPRRRRSPKAAAQAPEKQFALF